MRADNFFQALRSHWTPLPPGIQESFLAQVKELMALEDRLRKDPALAAYDQEIYPELQTLLKIQSPGVEPKPREVLHLCTQQIQIMENVFLALDLAEYHAHPLNRGWMSLFRRWSAAPTMRLLWPSLKSLYSKDFVPFAEYQLNLSGMEIVPEWHERASLSTPLVGLLELRDPEKAAELWSPLTPLQRVFRELGQEWPKTPRERGRQLSPSERASMEDYSVYFKPFSDSTGIWTVSHPESKDEVWGIALLAPHPEHTVRQRLMVWVRPAYRGVGLGKKLLAAALEAKNVKNEADRQKVLNENRKRLVIVLPPLRRDRPGYGDEMAAWLRFYGRKDFVRVRREDAKNILNWPTFDPAAFCLVMPEALRDLSR